MDTVRSNSGGGEERTSTLIIKSIQDLFLRSQITKSHQISKHTKENLQYIMQLISTFLYVMLLDIVQPFFKHHRIGYLLVRSALPVCHQFPLGRFWTCSFSVFWGHTTSIHPWTVQTVPRGCPPTGQCSLHPSLPGDFSRFAYRLGHAQRKYV